MNNFAAFSHTYALHNLAYGISAGAGTLLGSLLLMGGTITTALNLNEWRKTHTMDYSTVEEPKAQRPVKAPPGKRGHRTFSL